MPTIKNFLSLDVGAARIGAAMNLPGLTIVKAWGTVPNDDSAIDKISELVSESKISQLIVGLPRGMNGQETDQTKVVREFSNKLKASLTIPVTFQDEAVTSVQAEETLKQAGNSYSKGDIDAMAAVIILQDFIEELTKEVHAI